MEKTISQEERLRRAEEIYQRRRMAYGNGIRVSSSSVNKNKTKVSLFKKMALQLAICAVIYIIFYLIKNTNYIFSDNVITKTKELLSYDINFGNVYQQVNSFIEQNKDKFTMPGVAANEQSGDVSGETSNVVKNEENQEQQTNTIDETINKNENKNEMDANEIKEDNTTNKNETTNTQGGIGGAELNEVKEEKEETKKSQMELDAEYVKSKCSFKVPVSGTVTSRYGAREATEIISANHQGIDIGANTGTPIYASMEGTVTKVSSEGDYRKSY